MIAAPGRPMPCPTFDVKTRSKKTGKRFGLKLVTVEVGRGERARGDLFDLADTIDRTVSQFMRLQDIACAVVLGMRNGFQPNLLKSAACYEQVAVSTEQLTPRLSGLPPRGHGPDVARSLHSLGVVDACRSEITLGERLLPLRAHFDPVGRADRDRNGACTLAGGLHFELRLHQLAFRQAQPKAFDFSKAVRRAEMQPITVAVFP